ncbi:MAG TPA: hypothetical protein VEZ55_11500 [Chitinophagaceae bacterium]|jgi:hypothetical protein|nr:hypothetical protein [Chitinophagaceae bacterium]
MKNFNILFRFRGFDRIAMVYKEESSAARRYAIYFTDVELVLLFGGKVIYKEDGSFSTSKKVKAEDAEVLQSILHTKLSPAA